MFACLSTGRLNQDRMSDLYRLLIFATLICCNNINVNEKSYLTLTRFCNSSIWKTQKHVITTNHVVRECGNISNNFPCVNFLLIKQNFEVIIFFFRKNKSGINTKLFRKILSAEMLQSILDVSITSKNCR